MRRASCLVSPIPDHAFFEQSQFEGLLGDNFLEVLRFAPKLLDLVGRRRTSGVSGKPALAGLEELLRPGVIHALGDAFAPAKLGDRGFAAKAIEHNADLLFRPMVLPSCASDVADNAFRRRGRGLGFLSHLRSLAATMSQKSSLPQAASSVSQVLKRDTISPPSSMTTPATSSPGSCARRCADATWIIDATGQEITFAYVNAVLRDWARLGLMLANRGKWQGKTVVPEDWLTASAADAVPTRSPLAKYGYQIWYSAHPRRFALR